MNTTRTWTLDTCILDTLLKKKAKRTVPLNENIIVDFDNKDRLVGIEILNASKSMGKASLKRLAKSA